MSLNFPSNPDIGDRHTAVNGIVYSWDGDGWSIECGGISIGDAPADGTPYVRQDANWVSGITDITNEPIGDLVDVDINGSPEPSDGQVLTYVDGSPSSWIASDTLQFEDIGTDVGDLIVLENVGDSPEIPGLPAVDGSQLIDVPWTDGEEVADWGHSSQRITTDGSTPIDLNNGHLIDLSLAGDHTVTFISTEEHGSTAWTVIVESNGFTPVFAYPGADVYEYEDNVDWSENAIYWVSFEKVSFQAGENVYVVASVVRIPGPILTVSSATGEFDYEELNPNLPGILNDGLISVHEILNIIGVEQLTRNFVKDGKWGATDAIFGSNGTSDGIGWEVDSLYGKSVNFTTSDNLTIYIAHRDPFTTADCVYLDIVESDTNRIRIFRNLSDIGLTCTINNNGTEVSTDSSEFLTPGERLSQFVFTFSSGALDEVGIYYAENRTISPTFQETITMTPRGDINGDFKIGTNVTNATSEFPYFAIAWSRILSAGEIATLPITPGNFIRYKDIAYAP